MHEITNILCPIDFSIHSRRALDVALELARWYESGVTVLHVAATVPATVSGGGMPVVAAPALMDRDALAADLRGFVEAAAPSTAALDFVIREGHAVTEILAQADAIAADLIVLGTHGRSGFDRLMLGSVTEKLVRRAPCPVLTVPRDRPDGIPAGSIPFQRILCAIDFSPCSLQALDHAAALAQEADGRLIVLNVVSDVPVDWRDTLESPSERIAIETLLAERETRARLRLSGAVPDTVRTYCEVEPLVVRGTSGHAVVRAAASHHADLIVLGVRGRTAADLMLFGSTTQHVLRHATCPVLTIGPC